MIEKRWNNFLFLYLSPLEHFLSCYLLFMVLDHWMLPWKLFIWNVSLFWYLFGLEFTSVFRPFNWVMLKGVVASLLVWRNWFGKPGNSFEWNSPSLGLMWQHGRRNTHLYWSWKSHLLSWNSCFWDNFSSDPTLWKIVMQIYL